MQNVRFTETHRKGNMMCVPLWGKIFVTTPVARQQEIVFLKSHLLRKCVKILSIHKERGSNIQKTHTAQTSPTRAIITKTKHTTTNPANNSKITTRGTTSRDKNEGIKGNKTYKKARNIWFDFIIKRKGK